MLMMILKDDNCIREKPVKNCEGSETYPIVSLPQFHRYWQKTDSWAHSCGLCLLLAANLPTLLATSRAGEGNGKH